MSDPIFGRLDDQRVAGDQRRAGRPGDERRGVVERGDHGPHAVRAHHVAGDLGLAEAFHRHREPVVLAHGVGVVADQVGGLLDLADRLQPALAVLPSERRTVDDRPLGDQVGGAVEQLAALLPRCRGPTGPGGPCCCDGVVDVLAVWPA